ncbi:MAG: VWA domain-containing protein [Acidobacteriota bacterium]|nr:VWA domain-containing protein [Acidobacteriota bacterium]
MARLWWAGLFVALSATCLPAQQSPVRNQTSQPKLIPRTRAERDAIYKAEHHLVLSVQVSTTSGLPIKGLKAEDFTLLDNGKPTATTQFEEISGTAAEARAVFVFDEVNNTTRQLNRIRKQMLDYLKSAPNPLPIPITIGTFTGVDVKMGAESQDPRELLKAFSAATERLKAAGCIDAEDRDQERRLSFIPQAGVNPQVPVSVLDCENQRFMSSTTTMYLFAQQLGQSPGRVLLFWLGPGWPLLTDPNFRSDSSGLKSTFFSQVVGISQALIRSRVTVYALVSPENTTVPQDPKTYARAFFAGARNANDGSAGYLGLHVLAHQTGGLILKKTGNLGEEITQCLNDAKSYYRLDFDSSETKGFGEFHTLVVQVDRPGVVVRTNRFYYPAY